MYTYWFCWKIETPVLTMVLKGSERIPKIGQIQFEIAASFLSSCIFKRYFRNICLRHFLGDWAKGKKILRLSATALEYCFWKEFTPLRITHCVKKVSVTNEKSYHSIWHLWHTFIFFNVCMLIPSYMFIFLPNKLFDIEWEFYAAAVFLE